MNRPGARTRSPVVTYAEGGGRTRSDHLTTEEPLEIRLVAGSRHVSVGITMRTPGADFELAAGFLFAEGVVERAAEVRSLSYCVDRAVGEEQRFNIVNVELVEVPDVAHLERHLLRTSACGVCGSASIEALAARGVAPVAPPRDPLSPHLLRSLPQAMRAAQGNFEATGGSHAAALFSSAGEPVVVREDVGRHNAVDKVLGWALLEGLPPLHEHILMVSGRSSYEIVQKAAAGGIPVVCSVSAPSSLAVETARSFGIVLVGFLREDRFNVYNGAELVESERGNVAPK